MPAAFAAGPWVRRDDAAEGDDSLLIRLGYPSVHPTLQAVEHGRPPPLVGGAWGGDAFRVDDVLRAPFVPPLCPPTERPCGVGEALGYGCGVGWLLSKFHQKVELIYSALLPQEVVPYFTISDASKIESLDFCVCGATNPFYEDDKRNRWAALICNVVTGHVATNAAVRVPHGVKRLVAHVARAGTCAVKPTGVADGRPAAWALSCFAWHTSTVVADGAGGGQPWDDAHAVPPLATAAGGVAAVGDAAARGARLITAVTKCHEATNAKLSAHLDWAATMMELVAPIINHSEAEQRQVHAAVASFPLADAAAVDDVTAAACRSRTERAAVAQLAYEEAKTRRLLREVRGHVYRLIDCVNWRNARALRTDENRLFTDTFNTAEYQLYDLPSQVLLHSASCSLALRVCHGLDDSSEPMKTTGKLWVSKNYFAFKAGWLSRKTGGKKAKDKGHMVEVVPFDLVHSVLRDNAVIQNSIRVALPGGVMLYIGELSDTYRTATLLQTLVEKQRAVQRALSPHDAVLAVPPPTTADRDDAFAVTHIITVPCGLYLHDRREHKLDMVRRRCHRRVRVLERDHNGAPVPAALEEEARRLQRERDGLRSELDARHRPRLLAIKARLDELEPR
eukprot:gene10015-34028_t